MISIEKITTNQVETVTNTSEGQFSDVKAIQIEPSKLTKAISAFANSDGGDLYVGIREVDRDRGIRACEGFANVEAANGHLQIFEKLFPLGTDFQYEFLGADNRLGLVLHIQVNKTQAIVRASNDIPYIRRGAQNLPVDTQEALRRLEYSKGITTFEGELTNVSKSEITESDVIKHFIET